jgi:serine/threonine protein kinase
MGKDYWGTKRLKAPEEYIYGAVIDEVTNVFTLGALLLHFFGSHSESDISQMYKNNSFFPCASEKWELSEELYAISLRAVNEDRSKRYNTMSDFFITWNNALDSTMW